MWAKYIPEDCWKTKKTKKGFSGGAITKMQKSQQVHMASYSSWLIYLLS